MNSQHPVSITRETVMTCAELAAHLRLGRSTVAQLAKDGVIPSFTVVGRRRRFRLGAVLDALEKVAS